ncbi:MAG: glycosyltransferase family protein [Ignavibacterium album]|jgi:spore coat polysaccharide biosynthesis protein SpsF|uniref:glycosyltransferase family protein n=1 Tax=Ignavibacterium album TaxID=591197 RepID=UPI0026EC8CA4|nr:glycosyltransferase family protein [Ignavibacterium album]MCX8105395.1 glycosyltransferase family protein [Ignavibacterium album]
MKIVTVIQARTGSSRLPNKVLMPLAGKSLLERMIERVSYSELKGYIVVATTLEESDNIIEEICAKNNFHLYRGSTEDLLDRHYQAAKMFNADAVVKIPSDCPLIDFRIIDKVIDFFIKNSNKYDFVSNLHPATYPDGNDVEIMHYSVLETAWKNATRKLEREHTTPYIWENPDKFRIGNVEWETGLNYSMSYRFTIDYPEDYEFIKKVYDELYHKNPKFGLSEILSLLEEKPEIKKINEKYNGVNWYRNHLNELKTITADQTKII